MLWTNILGTNLIIVGDIGLALKNMHSALVETFIKMEAHFPDTLYGMSNAIHREPLSDGSAFSCYVIRCRMLFRTLRSKNEDGRDLYQDGASKHAQRPHREPLSRWKRIFLVRYTVSNAIPNTAV